jgi:succinate-semialdehyde dehydrogenase/glutarate-semialdehyde dehydrogenase
MCSFTQEIFGPVSSITRAESDNEALRLANATQYGLGASLWTKNIKKAKEFAARINAGQVFINSITKSDPRLPFGGINYGGYGREVSRYGLLEFVNIKTVAVS